MPTNFLNWLMDTDEGLVARIAAGVLVFAALAVVDLIRKGRQSRRWREYTFLLVAVGVAILYGIVNDQVTVTISWEYFFYGKEVSVLTNGVVPDGATLRWEAAKIGAKATWTAGLLLGVAVLFANNPSKTLPVLSDRKLYKMLPVVILSAAGLAAISGFVAWGLMRFDFFANWFSETGFLQAARRAKFVSVWGIHLGGYLGGLAGTAWAVLSVRRQRKRLAASGGAAGFAC